MDHDGDAPIGGEVRLRISGGLAHFPGLAREHCRPLDALSPADRRDLVDLAEQADFFACPVPAAPARPDARTYTLGLTLGAATREISVTEPVHSDALARLLGKVRQVLGSR